MLRKLMKMKTAFGQHLANRKDRKTKTSILPTVLTAQASVLRYCFFEGYETQSPGLNVKHVGCISGRGIRTLSEAGFSTTAHAIPDKNTENRHFHPISDVLPSREVVF